MYEELYQKIPDADLYLESLGLSSGTEVSLSFLNDLLQAQLTHIPFSNLDVWHRGICPDLGIEALFDKIILRHQGGYCYELNALFASLLQQLGFEVVHVGARITVGRDYLPPMTHRAMVCILGTDRYFCDVGFGTAACRYGIPLDGSVTPDGFFCRYQDGEGFIYEGQTQLMRFEDRPLDPVDFLVPNFYTSQNTALPFRANLSVSILTMHSRKQLVNMRLREYVAAKIVSEETVTTLSALSDLLLEHFGIRYSFTESR